MSTRYCSRVLSLWRRGQAPRCSARLAAHACPLLACITLARVRWDTTRAAAARWLSHRIPGDGNCLGSCPHTCSPGRGVDFGGGPRLLAGLVARYPDAVFCHVLHPFPVHGGVPL
eukprot:4639203-Pyramimonas_sp.AAC.1